MCSTPGLQWVGGGIHTIKFSIFLLKIDGFADLAVGNGGSSVNRLVIRVMTLRLQVKVSRILGRI